MLQSLSLFFLAIYSTVYPFSVLGGDFFLRLINTPWFTRPRLRTSVLLAPPPFSGRPHWGPLALFALLAGPTWPLPLTPFPLGHPVTSQVFSPSAPAVSLIASHRAV